MEPPNLFYKDYSSFIYSFVKFFVDPETFEGFLNNDLSGSAHMSYGTDIDVLLKHLMTSLCICLIEIFLFCYLRAICVSIYQPRCFCTPECERMELLPQGFFDWIKPSLNYETSCFISMGLDSYFFLRFINLLIVFFSTCGVFNLIILVPINYSGSTGTFQAKGLDRLSISNIAMSKVTRLNFHFVCSLITIAVFEVLVYHELQTVAKIRNSYLNSPAHRGKASSRVLLLGNLPSQMLDLNTLVKSFENFPGGIEHIWFVDDHRKYSWSWQKAMLALDILEVEQMRKLRKLSISPGDPDYETNFFYPPIFMPLISVPAFSRCISGRFPGILRKMVFQKPQSIDAWCIQNLSDFRTMLSQRMSDIASGNYVKQDKAFLIFRTQSSAYMAHQILLSSTFGDLNKSLIEVNHQDVLWNNLTRNEGWLMLIENYCYIMLLVVIICIYVIPVSLITLFSQIPLITQLFPIMSFLTTLPEEIKMIFSSLLPTILLSIVTTIQLKVLRVILYLKGSWTGAELEMNIQRWHFSFLFIQQFLVVSVSTSIIVVLLQVMEKPVSIPILLAANIPKSSIFFFKYLSVKTFSSCGSNFLKLGDLFMHYCIYQWTDRTPRMKFRRLSTLKKVSWGSSYATLSVYGAIGLTYITISPVVSVFMILILLLTLLYYKHALHYMYSHVNDSETNGKMYPRALFHLFSGIYCLECCMIGIFISSENENGECPMKFQSLIMACTFAGTIISNIVFLKRFHMLLNYLAVMSDERAVDDEDFEVLPQANWGYDMLYLHPCYKYEMPIVWLPRDPKGLSNKIIDHLSLCKSDILGGSTKGAELMKDGKFMTFKIFHEPPSASFRSE